MKQFSRVADFMTADPYSIELHHNLAAAERRMKERRVRQLSVLHDGNPRDMEREEAELLRSGLLADEMIAVNTSGG